MLHPNSFFNDLIEKESRLYFSYDLEKNKLLYANPAFSSFFEKEAESKMLYLLIHPADQQFMSQVFERTKHGGIEEEIVFRLIMQQRTFYLKMTATVTQKTRCLTGYLQDITEEKMHAENLLEFANKKNAVLNIISHDLATPLGTIQMLSSLLQGKADLLAPGKAEQILATIETNARRGIKMIQEFIKKEFLESIGVEVQKQRINIIKGMEQIIEEYKSSELHLHLIFELNCPYSEIYVLIDETKFFQAINNLISNSIKFTPDKGTISINVSRNKRKVLLEIADTGIGIPDKFHEKLFDKFNLAGRTGLKGESSVGLGMSIIKTIIEWHNGKIWFNSKEQEGTSFFIELEESV